MHNLLLDPLIRVRVAGTGVTRVSLPDLYAEMVQDRVTAFPALRPHQRHAWHAFLCQLGVIALHRAGSAEIPESPDQWRSLLRATTSEFADDQPWHLIVDDPGQPAFMQCPAPTGLDDYRGAKATPDDLDILLTAKNHELKQATAQRADPEDWIYALIDLQTIGGYLGAGNYQIARMNGGYSSRPCLGLAPAEGGPGARLCCDVRRMLSGRDALLARYPDYFRKDPGVALVWLEPLEWHRFPRLPRPRPLLHRDLPPGPAHDERPWHRGAHRCVSRRPHPREDGRGRRRGLLDARADERRQGAVAVVGRLPIRPAR